MLMEQIVLRCDARLIMANTDGFEFYIEESKEDLAKSIVAEWEKVVGLQMELAMYKAMYVRDVNNYLSVYDDSTVMDGMTDEERFNCVISRHCQTMSERQAVLQQLASEKSELTKYAEAMLAEQKSEPESSSAPDTAAQ